MFFGGGGGGFGGGFGGFGGQRSQSGPQPGGDAEIGLSISLDDAAFGAEKELTVTLPQHCTDCSGSGAKSGTTPVRCSECNGAGEVRRVRNTILGQMMTSAPCTACQGFGTIIEDECPTCSGNGLRQETITVKVQVPAGVETGSTMRLNDRGPAGARGGAKGRLYVHLEVAADERFVRDGDDLHHEAHISFSQAALGATITVPTLRESHEVVVEAGSQNATVHRIRHEGIGHLHGRGRGDLYVHLIVDVPTSLDEQSEALIRQLAELEGAPVAHHKRRGRK
jgi:molecular chaperone DnaJ